MWGVDSKARWIRWVFRLPTLKSQPGANSLDFSLPSAGYVRMHVCTYVCVSLCVKIIMGTSGGVGGGKGLYVISTG